MGFMDIFGVEDSEGVSATSYHLIYKGSAVSHQDSWLLGMAAEFLYTVFQYVVILANWMLTIVTDNASFLEPLQTLYEKVAGWLFTFIPPWSIAAVAFGWVAFEIFRDRDHHKNWRSGFVKQPHLRRIAAALAMVAVVLILARNPFTAVIHVLAFANDAAGEATSSLTGGSGVSQDSAGALVDATLRNPTMALNYGHQLTGECAREWAQAMASGSDGAVCGTEPEAGVGDVITALMMWGFPAVPMLVFAGKAIWKYLLHLSLAVWFAVTVTWVAAFNVHRRRGFERVSHHVSRAVAHTVMTVFVCMITIVAPPVLGTAIAGLIRFVTFSHSEGTAFLDMLGLAFGYAVSCVILDRVCGNTSLLARLLHADTREVFSWALANEGNSPQFTALRRFNPLRNDGGLGDVPAAKKVLEEERKARSLLTPGPQLTANADNQRRDTALSTSSKKDSDAVAQLIVPAQSVANDASTAASAVKPRFQVGPRPEIVGQSDPSVPRDAAPSDDRPSPTTHEQSSRMWQHLITGSILNRHKVTGDVFGYFTRREDQSKSGSDAAVSDPQLVAARQASVPGSSAPAAADDPRTSPAAPEPMSSAKHAASDRDSALAGSQEFRRSPGREAPLRPVAGNVFTDSALNAVAESVGATFVVGAPPALPTANPVSPLRAFRPDAAPLTPEPGSIPRVASAPPILVTPISSAGPETSIVEGEVIGTRNAGPREPDTHLPDQVRWNRRSLAAPEASKPATDPNSDPVLAPSGIGPGSNIHPASFHAPMADALAGSDVEATISDTAQSFAGAGQHVAIALDSHSSCVGVEFGSDPARRVVVKTETKFGDPK